jgi:GlpG protein
MRLIGHLSNESSARTFGDYLFVQGIENHVEFDKESGWAVWINDEDKIGPATNILEEFQKNPSAAEFARTASTAASKRADEAKKLEAYLKRTRANVQAMPASRMVGPISLVLILVCVAVFVLSKFGKAPEVVSGLFISTSSHSRGYLPEVMHGQIWRLVTPIFIHFDILHILFNMLWLRELGSAIEARQGSAFFTFLVVATAIVSNLAEYFFSQPIFGGMSGVVYALLGYIWMRAKFDVTSGYFLHPTTMTIMLIWLGVCYTGWLGPVANAAHTAGLLCGGIWGYLASLR